MNLLKIERLGTEVQGIRLRGNPQSPEPTYVRVVFPGGDVDVVRCEDGSYWIHVRVDSPDDVTVGTAEVAGKLVDARLDVRGKNASECDAGDFKHPGLYHLAVKIERST